MSKNKFSLSLIGLLFFLLIAAPFFSVGIKARGSEPAKLGAGLAGVLLRWNLVSSGFVSADKKVGGKGLAGALNYLGEVGKSSGLPPQIMKRLPPLEKKLAAAEGEYLWPIQLGYWGFTGGDGSLSLSGAEIRSASPEARVQVFQYLHLAKKTASAKVDIGKKTFSPPLDTFTLQLWVQPGGNSAGTIVGTGNWKLSLNNNRLELLDESGEVLLGTASDSAENWFHVSLVVEGENVEMFLNGTSVGQSVAPESLQVSSEVVLGRAFTGNLDELRLSPEPLERKLLRFDQPLDYLIGFPIITWAQSNWSAAELWHFYGGLLVSNLTIKRDSEVSSLKADNLLKVAEFLLGKVEGMPQPPDGLPGGVRNALTRLNQLGESEKLNEENRVEVEEVIGRLATYLDLD